MLVRSVKTQKIFLNLSVMLKVVMICEDKIMMRNIFSLTACISSIISEIMYKIEQTLFYSYKFIKLISKISIL